MSTALDLHNHSGVGSGSGVLTIPALYWNGVSQGALNFVPFDYGETAIGELTATEGSGFPGAHGTLDTYHAAAAPHGAAHAQEIEGLSTWMTDVVDNLTAINFDDSAVCVCNECIGGGIGGRDSALSMVRSRCNSNTTRGLMSSSLRGITVKKQPLDEEDNAADLGNLRNFGLPLSNSLAVDDSCRRKLKPGPSSSSTSTTTTKTSTGHNVSSSTPKTLKPRASRQSCKRFVDFIPKKSVTVDQLEHVRREKERRYHFSSKISALDCLLPAAAHNFKRDRYSIVSDSVEYVKSLQKKVDDLKRIYSEMKLVRTAKQRQQPRYVVEPLPPGCGYVDSTPKVKVHMAANEEGSKCFTRVVEYHIQVEGEGESAGSLGKYRCRSNYMSGAMKVLEQLHLDVCRCTITKMSGYTICVIIAKDDQDLGGMDDISLRMSTILASWMTFLAASSYLKPASDNFGACFNSNQVIASCDVNNNPNVFRTVLGTYQEDLTVLGQKGLLPLDNGAHLPAHVAVWFPNEKTASGEKLFRFGGSKRAFSSPLVVPYSKRL